MSDQWRYTCPVGHYSWRPRKEGYYCMQCGGRFSELVERSEGGEGFYYGDESGAWGDD